MIRTRLRQLSTIGSCAAVAAASHGCSPSAPTDVAVPVVVVRDVEVRDVDVEVHSPIELRALAEVDVGSKIVGYLESVLVDRGDRVMRGQALAVVRPSDETAHLVGARGRLAEAQAKSALTKQMADRAARVASFGGMSTQEFQQASAEHRMARAQEAAAAAQVTGHAMKLEEAKIAAPFDGVVTRRRLDPGALVGQVGTTPIVSIAKTDVLRAIITVTERDASRVRVSQQGHVSVDALPNVVISGQVARVSPSLDSATRTCQVELWLSNVDGRLMPGMYGRGAIVVDRHPAAVIVPSTAIRVSSGKTWAFVVRGNKIERREVVVGEDRGTWLEITSGVSAREDVVIAGADGISDGAMVQAIRGVNPYTGVPVASANPTQAQQGAQAQQQAATPLQPESNQDSTH